MFVEPIPETSLERVDQLRAILQERAVGGPADETQFQLLRRALRGDARLWARLPRWLTSSRTMEDFWSFIKAKHSTYEARRQFLREEFGPILEELERGTPHADVVVGASLRSNAPAHVEQAWAKALQRRSSDPEGAITAARSLLESVLKHVLDAQGVAYEDSFDLPKLYNLSARALRLTPEQHDAESIRRILGGCSTVVAGLGALRNTLGDAHGRSASGLRPAARHAALAVNLAGAMATFLIDTLAERTKDGSTQAR